MSGRRKTTGRFETRAELIQRVQYHVEICGLSMARSAELCEVSPPTVADIVQKRLWERLEPSDYEIEHPVGEYVFPRDRLSPGNLAACGVSGWDFPRYAVHLPARVLNELERLELEV